METYLKHYDTYEKQIVYYFNSGNNGIGDILKYFLIMLDICMRNNIRLYYCNYNQIIDKYLKIKIDKMKMARNEMKHAKLIMLSDFASIENNILYSIIPRNMYSLGALRTIDEIYSTSSVFLHEVFMFDEAVLLNANNKLNINNRDYMAIHLRLGDYYLETDKQYIVSNTDIRRYNEQTIYTLIENNKDSMILFCCDNHAYKLKLKAKYPNIMITDYEIGHTALRNTSDIQILNTVTDFYLLAKATHIYMASASGFPIMAAKFYNVPINKIAN